MFSEDRPPDGAMRLHNLLVSGNRLRLIARRPLNDQMNVAINRWRFAFHSRQLEQRCPLIRRTIREEGVYKNVRAGCRESRHLTQRVVERLRKPTCLTAELA